MSRYVTALRRKHVNELRRNSKAVILFLLLSFLLPLINIILMKNYDVFRTGAWNLVLLGFGAMTPTLAAILVVLMLGGRSQFKSFIMKCFIKNIRVDFIIIALLLPAVVLTLAKATYCLLDDTISFAAGINLKRFFIIIWALVAEEIGWRGFLQDKLDGYFGSFFTPIVIGILWAAWHYHLFLLGAMSAPIALFSLGCIADSYGLYWITKMSRGNVIPASLWHFVGNLFMSVFLINPEYNGGSTLLYTIYVIYSLLMAVGISIWGLKQQRKNRSKGT